MLALHCRVQHLLQLLRNTEEQQDQSRAKIADWLSSEGKFLDVGAVNANLDTSIHCAARSSSPLTMQVGSMLLHVSVACLSVIYQFAIGPKASSVCKVYIHMNMSSSMRFKPDAAECL